MKGRLIFFEKTVEICKKMWYYISTKKSRGARKAYEPLNKRDTEKQGENICGYAPRFEKNKQGARKRLSQPA